MVFNGCIKFSAKVQELHEAITVADIDWSRPELLIILIWFYYISVSGFYVEVRFVVGTISVLVKIFNLLYFSVFDYLRIAMLIVFETEEL